jgi:2-succinyl-6-hydroxy-2,4-cyclohexadiene-1-carboxylate synthase
VSGRSLHVERRGRGPALVLLHGFTGTGQSLAEVAQMLERDYETLAPALPGHGHSADFPGAGAYGFDDCVDDLAATLESAGHRRAHWLGYSMGARLALGCAVRHPGSVASLVLVGGRAGIADPVEREARRRQDEALAARIESVGVETFVDEWLGQPMFASLRQRGAKFLAEQRRQRVSNSARALADSLRRLGPAAQPPLFDALPGVDVPVLLVAGALDRKFVALAHDLAGRLPHAEICEVAGAGHAAHLEQPEAFVHAVEDFLRRATAPAPSVHLRSVQETAS